MNNFKLGSVPYLNAKPLHAGFDSKNLMLLPPRELVKAFDQGTIQAALLPTYYLLQNPELRIVRGLGIGCLGTVLSVLVQPLPESLEKFRLLQPSSESVTSNRLAEVILKKYLKRPFEWVPQSADAQVIIGDKALEFKSKNPTSPVLDLGEAWWGAVELPFVFALWAIHPSCTSSEVNEMAALIRSSWEIGKAKRASFAKTPLEYQYLQHYLSYEFDARFEDGIARWSQDLVELQLLPSVRGLNWV